MAPFDWLRSEPEYNTRAVVRRTGVPADTFRAWERRYGLPRPSRTPGNQRLYSERDIGTIDWLREQTRQGLTISQAVARFNADGPASTPAAPPARLLASSPPRLPALQQQLLTALIAFDAARADRIVEEALALLPVEEVCRQLIEPVLVEIGARWARGEVTVGVEHFASGLMLRKLGALFQLSRPETGRGPLLAACLEGELHEAGLLLTSLFLSRRGFRIVYLGANLPLADLIHAVRTVRPALVLLSTATPAGARQLIAASRQLQAAARALPAPRPIIGYGGQVFASHPDLRDQIAAHFLGHNAEEAVQGVEAALTERIEERG